MASSILLSGCASDPYVPAPSPRPGLIPNTELQETLRESTYQYQPGTTNLKTSYVSIDAARAYGQFVVDAYENALRNRSRTRSALNLGTLAGALTSIGVGLTGGSEDVVLGGALTSTALGISGQLLITKDHETAYALGAKSIRCVLTAATNARSIEKPTILAEMKRNTLSQHLAEYRQAASEADEVAKRTLRNANKEAQKDAKNDASLSAKKMDVVKQVIETAEGNIEMANRLLQASNILGEQLVNKIEDIRWTINDAVRRAEPDILVLDNNLRSIFVSRVQGIGATIPKKVQLQTVPELKRLSSRTEKFSDSATEAQWTKARLLSEQIQKDESALEEALNTAIGMQNNAPVAFAANLFQGCAINANELPTGTAGIMLSPASHSIAAGQDTVVSASINGGSAPFAVEAEGITETPTVSGRMLNVSIKAKEAIAGAQIVVRVSDLYGRQANFFISVPAEQTAATGGKKGNNANELAKKVTEAQKALGFSKDDPNKKLDGAIGPQTRQAIIDFLKGEDQIGSLTAMLAGGQSAENNENCSNQLSSAKTTLLKLGETIDKSNVTVALDKLYMEQQMKSTTEVEGIDDPLLDFFIACKADLAPPN